jgi:hypothetical protein
MNATSATASATSRRRRQRGSKLLANAIEVERIAPESRRQAAAVLEVLAGIRTPEEAATALSISVPTYYNLETRALRGLVHACTPEPPGRKMAMEKRLRESEARCTDLQRQLQRYQALLRTAQRAAGLVTAPESSKTRGTTDNGRSKTRRKRAPRVRALRAIETLNAPGRTDGDGGAHPDAPDAARVALEAGS